VAENSEQPNGEESPDELDGLREELREKDEVADHDKSELDEFRQEVAERYPSEESA
jgi:hypothetical protein